MGGLFIRNTSDFWRPATFQAHHLFSVFGRCRPLNFSHSFEIDAVLCVFTAVKIWRRFYASLLQFTELIPFSFQTALIELAFWRFILDKLIPLQINVCISSKLHFVFPYNFINVAKSAIIGEHQRYPESTLLRIKSSKSRPKSTLPIIKTHERINTLHISQNHERFSPFRNSQNKRILKPTCEFSIPANSQYQRILHTYEF